MRHGEEPKIIQIKAIKGRKSVRADRYALKVDGTHRGFLSVDEVQRLVAKSAVLVRCPHCGSGVPVEEWTQSAQECGGEELAENYVSKVEATKRFNEALAQERKAWTCSNCGEKPPCEKCNGTGIYMTKFMGSDSTREVIPCPDCGEKPAR